VGELARRHGASAAVERFVGHFAVARVGELRIGLLAPQTFMNDSGRAVGAALAAHPELEPSADLAVVYDDLDLPLGRLRLRPSGGAGGHRGMTSLFEALEHRDFARLRFGIGRPASDIAVVEHVLADFSPHEEALLVDRVALAADAIECLFELGMSSALDRFNRADAHDETSPDSDVSEPGPEGPPD
jgi:PTH1 family peptidyl-tRNA hydrolase